MSAHAQCGGRVDLRPVESSSAPHLVAALGQAREQQAVAVGGKWPLRCLTPGNLFSGEPERERVGGGDEPGEARYRCPSSQACTTEFSFQPVRIA